MPTYQNGYIPDDLLITFQTGHNATDGDWKWQLSPGTHAKHLALVARAKNRTGRILRPSDGWSCYRPMFAQIYIRKIKGNGAAWPGTSSHGGFWENHQTLAIDYGNWEAVYQGFGGLDAFAEDCRAVGLQPLMIVPARGYPYEPWHVIDPDPWAPAPASTIQEGFLMALTDTEQEELLTIARGLLSSQNQVLQFQNVGAIRAYAEGNLSSQNQVTLFQNIQTTRDRVEALYARDPAAPNVDEAALAAALAPLLAQNMGRLDDATIAAIAKATADEQARRLAS